MQHEELMKRDDIDRAMRKKEIDLRKFRSGKTRRGRNIGERWTSCK
jgi:hypothetical protein